MSPTVTPPSRWNSDSPPLLSVRNLRVSLEKDGLDRTGWVLRGVDLDLRPGEKLALVGESGCGKSMTALSILHLLPRPPMELAEGEIRFRGRNLSELSAKEWRRLRGKEVGIVFQEPLTSLNPVVPVGRQIGEVLQNHGVSPAAETKDKVVSLLRQVGLPDAERVARQYPHQLSGGMCQRAVIAMAIACGPALLIADEPTTALDVTVQTQILDLLFRMTEERALAVLFITHDLRLVRGHADRVVILYAGRVAEQGTPADLFDHPQHPYTEGLLAALPEFSQRGHALFTIPGSVPTPFDLWEGCAFAARCPRARERCRSEEPVLAETRKGHMVRCFYPSGK